MPHSNDDRFDEFEQAAYLSQTSPDGFAERFNRGFKGGFQDGYSQGILRSTFLLAETLLTAGFSDEEAIRDTGLFQEEVLAIRRMLEKEKLEKSLP